MTSHVLLNNVDHKDLRINIARSKELGDDVMSCAVYYPEFRNIQAHYPIVFSKNTGTGEIIPIALLGLQQGENLFLTDDGWDNDYVPMTMEMQPFLIGYDGPDQTVIHVDMDSPRINDAGEAVFLPMGGNSPYLEHITEVLSSVHSGHQYNGEFISVLEQYELLEPFVLDMELVDGTSNRLSGFMTINEEKLYALGAEALGDLNEKQFLQAIFMAVASVSNFADLIRRKNMRVSGATS